MPRTLRRRAAAFLIAGAALGVGAPPTAAAPVEGGSLAWHTVNDFGPSARTWFGYVTNPSPAGGANGTVTPVAPVFGPTLTGASPRGAAVRWGMPAVAGGDYDPATRTGTIEFDGELRYASTLHGFDYSLVDPQVVLDGANSKLYANGVKVEGTTSGTFDRSQPVFDLDLSAATFTDTQITGIAPSIATAAWGFPATYPVGAGPDRNPNTFGSFTVTFGATLSATPTTGLDPAGATVTVTGEGFKTGGAGAYRLLRAGRRALRDGQRGAGQVPPSPEHSRGGPDRDRRVVLDHAHAQVDRRQRRGRVRLREGRVRDPHDRRAHGRRPHTAHRRPGHVRAARAAAGHSRPGSRAGDARRAGDTGQAGGARARPASRSAARVSCSASRWPAGSPRGSSGVSSGACAAAARRAASSRSASSRRCA